MAASISSSLLTTEQLLALPENGTEYELIRGQLREKPMTRRNPLHSSVISNLSFLLKDWLRHQPEPRGRVLSGEAGFRIRRNPDTTVGIDVAYISAELAANTSRKAKLVDAAPLLAVEILSPSDVQEDVTDKIEEYLAAGVPQVWLVEPFFSSVSVYRPDSPPVLYNVRDDLPGDPELPGFRVPVAEIFAD